MEKVKVTSSAIFFPGKLRLQPYASASLYICFTAFIVSPIMPDAKWLYAISSVFSVILIMAFIVRHARMPTPFFAYSFFILSFLPSVFYAHFDTAWAQSQFLSLLMRTLPVGCYLIYNPSIACLKRLVIGFFWFNTIIYFIWIFSNHTSTFDVGGNIENVGASAILALLPFVLAFKHYKVAALSIILILLSDSRMGLFVSAFTLITWLSIRFIPRRLSVHFVLSCVIAATVFVLIIAWDVMMSSYLPGLNEYGNERVRRAMQFLSILAVKENPVWGIGMGQISSLTEQIWGVEILAHGMFSYVWAQCGIFVFIFYLFIATLSIVRPMKLFAQSGNVILFAIGVSAANSFLLFLTRTQQDSPYFFLSIALGIFAYRFHKKLAKPEGLRFAHR